MRLIPQMLLKKCTFGVDNYNLPIVDPPMVTDDLVSAQERDATVLRRPRVEDDEELLEEGGCDDET